MSTIHSILLASYLRRRLLNQCHFDVLLVVAILQPWRSLPFWYRRAVEMSTTLSVHLLLRKGHRAIEHSLIYVTPAKLELWIQLQLP